MDEAPVAGYDAVVFDSDGVLVELTDLAVLRNAARAAFEAVGVADPDERFVELAAVHEDVDALAAIESRYGVALSAFWAAREREAIDRQRALVRRGEKPLYDDVRVLETLDVPLGVVSNNQQDTVGFVVDHHGIADQFGHVAGRDPTLADMRRRKPEPEFVETALDALGASDALYVGDSPTDVVAAARAGADSAFLRRDHNRTVTLERTPTYEVESLWALVGERPDED